MSHNRPVSKIFVLFMFLSCKVLAQNSCSLPDNRQGQCVQLNECELYLNVFENKLVDDVARQFLKTTGLCRIAGNTPIVCCEQDATKCITPENKPGACVPVRRCNTLIRYFEQNNFDGNAMDYYQKSRCEHPGNQDRVCCPIFPHPITGQISNKPKGQKLRFPSPGEMEGSCGVQMAAIRIVGGNVTNIYEYPWSVLLKYCDGRFACGGSLIHPRYVLTAAHCVTGPAVEGYRNVISVRLGETDLTTQSECVEKYDCNDPPVDIEVEEIVPHPGFSDEFEHDIALIRLKKRAPYTDFIKPICLQPRNMPTPTRLTVVGWGTTEYMSMSDKKLFLNVPLRNFNECKKQYARSQIKFGNGQFCAGGEEFKESCQGDSGGPLMFYVQRAPHGSIFYQSGIVSIGTQNCGLSKIPTIYTKVTEYLQWIEDNTYE